MKKAFEEKMHAHMLRRRLGSNSHGDLRRRDRKRIVGGSIRKRGLQSEHKILSVDSGLKIHLLLRRSAAPKITHTRPPTQKGRKKIIGGPLQTRRRISRKPKATVFWCIYIAIHGHLLHQTTFTPGTLYNFYTRHLLHQTPSTPDTCYTRQLLQQTAFTPGTLYTRNLLPAHPPKSVGKWSLAAQSKK